MTFNIIKEDYTKIANYNVDREFLLKCIREINWKVIYHANYKIGKDFEICMAIIDQDWTTLELMDDHFKNDEEIIKYAISKNWGAIKFMGDSIKNNLSFVSYLINQSNSLIIIKYTGEILRNNFNFMYENVIKNSKVYSYISKELANNALFHEKIVNIWPDLLSIFPIQFRANKKIVMTAVKKRGYIIKYASNDLKNDREVAMAAINNDWRSLIELSLALRNNHEIVANAMLENEDAFQFAGENLKESLMAQFMF